MAGRATCGDRNSKSEVTPPRGGRRQRAVRFYENPPAKGMTVETHWSDIWLSADDWAEAFEAAEPGTPHNEAREAIWEELLAILMDSRDGDVPADLLRKSLLQNRELRTALNRAWPLIEAADLVADLWSVPAYLRLCAPRLSPDEVQQLQRGDAQAWTVSDLPLLDAARRRLGDPQASRRKRRHDAAVAAEREQMARVVDDLILEVPVYRGREVTGFAQDGPGVDVELSDGRPLRTEYLVGCDGGRSLIRKAAVPGLGRPRGEYGHGRRQAGART